jgi:AcrR family transcriptional regulator
MTASSVSGIIPSLMNSSDEEIAEEGPAAQVTVRRSGRRPGDSGTRDAIRAAAARQFAELGFDRTSLRSIAREAGVDQKLVAYFFGTKQQLFVEVVRFPFEPAVMVPVVFGGDRESVGERVARFIVSVLDDPEARQPLVGLVRAAASEPEAARMVRELLAREVIARIVEALGVDDADVRASLVGSQIVGLLMARHIVGLEPLVSLPTEQVVAAIAPNLQRYLVEPL